jgi:hypothetical protein
MKNKVVLENHLFKIIALLISFILSFFRSLKLFFFNSSKIKKNDFFNLLDFCFRKWTRYFWKMPNIYKLASLVRDIINFIFKKKS